MADDQMTMDQPPDIGSAITPPPQQLPVDTSNPMGQAAPSALGQVPSNMPAAAPPSPMDRMSTFVNQMLQQNQQRTTWAESLLRGWLENANKPYEEPGTPKGMAGKALYNLLVGFLGGMPGLRNYYTQQQLAMERQRTNIAAASQYVNMLKNQQAGLLSAYHNAMLQQRYQQMMELWYAPRGRAAEENAETARQRLEAYIKTLPTREDLMQSQIYRNVTQGDAAGVKPGPYGSVMNIPQTMQTGQLQYYQPPTHVLSPGQFLSASVAKSVAAEHGMNANKVTSSLDLPPELQQQAIDRMVQTQLASRPQAGQMGALTPEGVDMAADQFAKTGRMVSLGMGNAGLRTQIINRAAQMYPHIDLATQQAEFHSNQNSLSLLTRNRDSIVAFENTAMKNLDLFVASAKNIVDTGSPIVNMPLRYVTENVLGSRAMTSFQAFRRVALNEVAKVVTNPTLTGQPISDAARREIETMSQPNATLGQIYEAAQALKMDMGNRHTALDEQIGAIQGRLAAPPTQRGPGSSAPMPPIGPSKIPRPGDTHNGKKVSAVEWRP